VYYGTKQGPERDAAIAADIPFRALTASAVRGRTPRRLIGGPINLWRGMRDAGRYLDRDRPDAVFATGGYASAPVGRPAKQRRIPLVVFLPDVRPGWAVRFLQRYASTVACAVEPSLEYVGAKGIVTGYPVRAEFTRASREQGQRSFDLDPALPTLLVMGGSLGAHTINLVIHDILETLLDEAQVVHITGPDEEHWLVRARDALPTAELRSRYHPLAYTNEIALAMAASDLAVVRAGASTLGELPVSGLPAIVIPGTFSDQHHNAAYLEERGAAVTVTSDALDDLGSIVLDLLRDEPRRREMAEAMRTLARPDATQRIAALLREAVL
jgi:UDP-N-acetylglucosamine--N-acetylmuramyl-(pentapeptide) pyrophosphoryl-undecaprenol N-acetylglucosamine transferase